MARSALDEMSAAGAFVRTASTFHNFISRDQSSLFPPESGRYHLYISYACPWASRCLAYLKIKGLEKAIGFSSVNPIWGRTKQTDDHMGWVFPASVTEEPCAEPDPLNGAKSIRELYEIPSTNYTGSGKYTVPVLWDKKLKTIKARRLFACSTLNSMIYQTTWLWTFSIHACKPKLMKSMWFCEEARAL